MKLLNRIGQFVATPIFIFGLISPTSSRPSDKLVIIFTGYRDGKVAGCGCNGSTDYNIAKEAAFIRTEFATSAPEMAYLIDIDRQQTKSPEQILKDYIRLMKYDFVTSLDSKNTSSKLRILETSDGNRSFTLPKRKGSRIIRCEIVTDNEGKEESLLVDGKLFQCPKPGRILVLYVSPRSVGDIQAKSVELALSAREDTEVKAMLETKAKDDRQHMIQVLTEKPKFQIRSEDPSSCGTCHQQAYSTWLSDSHARAMATLETKGRFEASCVSCHSTAVRAGRSINLEDLHAKDSVTCISCHDQEGIHRGDLKRTFREETVAQTCTPCHTKENSPKFKWEVYRNRVHGGVVK